MSSKYVVLTAEDQFKCIQTALVHVDTFKEDPDPHSYFVRVEEAKKVGEVEIDGDDHLLPDILNSD
jgi:hypothetical protein